MLYHKGNLSGQPTQRKPGSKYLTRHVPSGRAHQGRHPYPTWGGTAQPPGAPTSPWDDTSLAEFQGLSPPKCRPPAGLCIAQVWGVQIGAFPPKIHHMGPHLSFFLTSFRDTPGLISISSPSSSSWPQAEGTQGALSEPDSSLCSADTTWSVKLDSKNLAPTRPPTPAALCFPTERRSRRPGRSAGVENWPKVPDRC